MDWGGGYLDWGGVFGLGRRYLDWGGGIWTGKEGYAGWVGGVCRLGRRGMQAG